MSPPSARAQMGSRKPRAKIHWSLVGDIALYPLAVLAILVAGAMDPDTAFRWPSLAKFLFAVVMSFFLVFLAERVNGRMLTPEEQEHARAGKDRNWPRRAGIAAGLGLFWRLVSDAVPKLINMALGGVL